MDVKAYYETYWSPSGFLPTGHLRVPQRELFEAHIETDYNCLDVGCGDGQTSGLWLKSHAASYVGVDVSEAAVELARKAGLDAHPIGAGLELPFADSSFDAVVCIEVLEHLFEPQRTAAEMLRVLRPGGVLMVTVPNVAYWRRRLDLAALGRWNPLGDGLSVSQPWRDPHIRFYSRGALRRMLLSVGFNRVAVGGHGGTLLGDIPYLRRICRRRGGWSVPDWRPNPVYRQLEMRLPALFGYRLHAVAWRPTGSSVAPAAPSSAPSGTS